jgi:hypothetical protein
MDLDYYGNYYLGWDRWWQFDDLTSWLYGTPLNRTEWGGWSGTEYNVMWGKVAPVSQSLQWITDLGSLNYNRSFPYPDIDDGNIYHEYINNRDLMYEATVSPYGGLVLVLAETQLVARAYDNLTRNEYGVYRILIWGINGVTGYVTFSRHINVGSDNAIGLQ